MKLAIRIAVLACLSGCLLTLTAASLRSRPLPLSFQSSPASPPSSSTDSSPQSLPSPSAAAQRLNSLRQARALPSFETDPDLAAFLDEFPVDQFVAQVDLPLLFDQIEGRFPQVHEIAAKQVFGASQRQILEDLENWPALEHPNLTHLAAQFYHPKRHRERLGCVVVLVRKLQPLQLPVSSLESGEFFDQCRRCDRGHGLALRQLNQNTLIIRCPHCRQPYNLIAVDSKGLWRRANHFLIGFDEIDPGENLDPEKRVLHLWRQVTQICRYRRDTERIGGADSWEFPSQTALHGSGDCEDSSLLLADLLIANGFDARVVLGRHQGEGHAWCVVRIGKRVFLLESTNPHAAKARLLPHLEDVALEYEPAYMFDREHLYFKDFEGWTSNYWSSKVWTAVRYGEDAPNTSNLAKLETEAQESL